MLEGDTVVFECFWWSSSQCDHTSDDQSCTSDLTVHVATTSKDGSESSVSVFSDGYP